MTTRNHDGPMIRAWAAAQGTPLPERGRIPAPVREAYSKAHGITVKKATQRKAAAKKKAPPAERLPVPVDDGGRRDRVRKMMSNGSLPLPALPALGSKLAVTGLALTPDLTAQMAVTDGEGRQWLLDVKVQGSWGG